MSHPDLSEFSPKRVSSDDDEGARTDLERLLDGARAESKAEMQIQDSNSGPNFLVLGIVALALILISLGIHLFWPLL